jgi:hypothetical protein
VRFLLKGFLKLELGNRDCFASCFPNSSKARQNSVGWGPDVNLTYRRVSVGVWVAEIVPSCFDWSGAARNAVCHPRTRPRNTPVVIDLAMPCDVHRMFTRPAFQMYR